MSIENVTTEDIYNAFRDHLWANTPSFKYRAEVYQSYISEGTKRPALYLNLMNEYLQNDIDGKPPITTLNLEVHFRADRNGFINRTGPQVLLPLAREVKSAFKPNPVTNFCTLGFKRGWVMHVFCNSVEYFYDMSNDADVMDCVITMEVLCCPNDLE